MEPIILSFLISGLFFILTGPRLYVICNTNSNKKMNIYQKLEN